MEKKISTKIKKKIDNIITLKKEIENWRKLSEIELLDLIKKFEKTPRDEASSFFNEYFKDSKFAETLIAITQMYSKNSKILLYIISALGNMMRRYKLPETDEIYSLMVDNSQKKGIAPYVAIYLPKMEIFKGFPNKWEYYMSIKTSSPKKLAETAFIDIIKENLEKVPLEFHKEVTSFLEDKINNSNSEYNKNLYSEMIKTIQG